MMNMDLEENESQFVIVTANLFTSYIDTIVKMLAKCQNVIKKSVCEYYSGKILR